MAPRIAHVLALAALTACADAPGEVAEDPNAGLLRDFLDGKFDAAGHPLNAKVVEAEDACGGEALRGACRFVVPAGAMTGELTANVRLRVRAHATRGDIVTVRALGDGDRVLASETLTVARLRAGADWIDVAVRHEGFAAIRAIVVEPQAGARIDVDYVEIFPQRFGLVVAPGSGVFADGDRLTFEVPRARKLEQLALDGVDLRPRLDALLAAGVATRTTTEFRTIIEVPVGELAPARADVAELRVKTGGDAARVQLRRASAPCAFEGDPAGTKVLVTGFQPFPADGWHENVSAVAVTAMHPAALRGAQVMRLVLPVEYDRAPHAVVDAIERCAPDVVISFGQGGGAIALEEVAYNLQDTGEIAGGVPDNRGVIRGATPIDEVAPATRATLLPLAAIEDALLALGEEPRRSTDPGRYICNNTMFLEVGAIAGRGRAGFIHLPYTTHFDDAVRARFGAIATAAVQAAVDADPR